MAVKERSFWSTIPGLVTGIAGLLTGIVGILTVATQLGWIGSDDGDPASDQTSTTVSPEGGGGGGGQSVTIPPLLGGGSATTAVGAGGLTVEPTSLTFSGLGDREEVVTVRNTTNAAIGLRAPAITGVNRDQFTATNVDCGTSLGAGRSCSVRVTFASTRGGESTATLVIEPTNGAAKEVRLTGRAVL